MWAEQVLTDQEARRGCSGTYRKLLPGVLLAGWDETGCLSPCAWDPRCPCGKLWQSHTYFGQCHTLFCSLAPGWSVCCISSTRAAGWRLWSLSLCTAALAPGCCVVVVRWWAEKTSCFPHYVFWIQGQSSYVPFIMVNNYSFKTLYR